MSEEEKTVNIDEAVPEGTVAADKQQEIITGTAELLRPAASARGEGTDNNTLNRYALKFAATCECHRPFGTLRFTEASPSGQVLAVVASSNPNQVILNKEPQNQALTNWCDVRVKICDCDFQDCQASLYVSDIPGTGNIQAALLATKRDQVVYCFSGILCGNLNVLECMSCMDPAPGSHDPCNDPCHKPGTCHDSAQ
ncbi:MAG: hypothetical protein JL50_07300 [Peptococcaceae bacterium BICA1-7]|nr:MAG: hypothetical protein JL50_07300 [Peptococcaceae bacterium BICA1-7]HBV99127.1 hypothetical protein [Desulfotomaculum sp.]